MNHAKPPQHRDSLYGVAIAFAAVIIALLVSAVLASRANAGGFRSAPRCSHHAAAAFAPGYQAAGLLPYPVISYEVGQALQGAAVDEFGFRRSPSQHRLTYLEGFYAHATLGQPKGAVENQAETEDAETCEACAENEPPQFLAKPKDEPAAAPDDFARSHPLTAAACIGCHAGPDSIGGFSIVKRVTEAKAAGDCETLLAIADSIASGRMPDKKPMSDADARKAIAELLAAP